MKRTNRLQASWWMDSLFFLLCFSIPFVLYGNLFLANQLPFDTDGIQYFANKLFALEALKSGQLPLWNPYLTAGMPFLEDLSSLLYPPDWLGLFLPLKWFVYSYYGLHLAVGGYFFNRYLRELDLDSVVSYSFGFIYAMSIHIAGYRKSHIVLIVPTVSLAVILYLVQKYLNTQKLRWLLGSAVAMAVVFMCGVIQYMFYIDLIVFLYLLISGIHYKMPVRQILGHGILWGLSYLGMICVQLLPVLGIMSYYSKSGAGRPDYQYFTSYCMHPFKLIMMMFPNIFGENILQPFGIYNSSEMDIEIFLGVGVLALLLFGLWRQKKQFNVKMFALLALGVLIYCVNAHLPFLPHLLYRIPFVGGFRCSSRALFIFIFFCYTIAAYAVSSLRDAIELRRFAKWAFCLMIMTILVAVAYSAGVLYSNTDYFADAGKMVNIGQYLKKAFLPALVALVLLNVLSWGFLLIQKRKLFSIRYIFIFFCVGLVVLTIGETLRFSTLHANTSTDVLAVDSKGMAELKSDLGSSKLLLTQDIPDGAFASPLQGNANMAMGMASINGYVSFNNPKIYKLFSDSREMRPSYNATGLLTGFPRIGEVLWERNSMLSMLGVKYILDPHGYVPQNGNCLTVTGEEGQDVVKNQSLSLACSSQMLVEGNYAFDIEPQTLYLLSFDAETSEQQSISVDLYGGPSYDYGEQENRFQLAVGKGHYEYCFNSQDTSLAEGTILRVLAQPSADVVLTNITLQKIDREVQTGVYVYKTEIEGIPVYENKNVKELLFIPECVEKVSDQELFLDNSKAFNLTKVSYISEGEARVIDANAKVQNIVQTLNTASAKVTSAKETFINFSQCYFPGWGVYIDGQKSRIFVVDGTIQGAYIPAGTHIVEFRYHPTILYVSAGVSGITFCLVFLWIFVEYRKEKKLLKI